MMLGIFLCAEIISIDVRVRVGPIGHQARRKIQKCGPKKSICIFARQICNVLRKSCKKCSRRNRLRSADILFHNDYSTMFLNVLFVLDIFWVFSAFQTRARIFREALSLAFLTPRRDSTISWSHNSIIDLSGRMHDWSALDHETFAIITFSNGLLGTTIRAT